MTCTGATCGSSGASSPTELTSRSPQKCGKADLRTAIWADSKLDGADLVLLVGGGCGEKDDAAVTNLALGVPDRDDGVRAGRAAAGGGRYQSGRSEADGDQPPMVGARIRGQGPAGRRGLLGR